MKSAGILFLICWQLVFLSIKVNAASTNQQYNSLSCTNYQHYNSDFPVAINDTFELIAGCGNHSVSGNILENDLVDPSELTMVTFVYAPDTGYISVHATGQLTYTIEGNFTGVVTFTYRITEVYKPYNYSEAKVVILIENDNDCDGVPDIVDIDDDNDGILDYDEGLTADTDSDGIPNVFDIDSDNDGILDNIESQSEKNYIAPIWSDSDGDGWDDAYDPDNGGVYFTPVDTDDDGTPDFLDNDSDDDLLDDLLEGNNTDPDNIHQIELRGTDSDGDGLDDYFDSVEGWINKENSLGSNAPLPDFDHDGIRDWREFNKEKSIEGEGNAVEAQPSFFTISPNPANATFMIRLLHFTVTRTFKVKIFQMDGRVIIDKKIQQQENIINASTLKQGIYFIQIQSAQNSYTKQLIITH